MSEKSRWTKDVKQAVIERDMSIKQLAETIGYSYQVVSQVMNGRYSNSTINDIAGKINDVLGTEGMPERTVTPSDAWCEEVKIALLKKHMSVSEFANSLGTSRDRVSLVVNGKAGYADVVNAINEQFAIKAPVLDACDD